MSLDPLFYSKEIIYSRSNKQNSRAALRFVLNFISCRLLLEDGVNNGVIERFLIICQGRCASWSRGADQSNVGYPALGDRCLLQALPKAQKHNSVYWKAQPTGKGFTNVLGPFYAMVAHHNMIPPQLQNEKSCVQFILFFNPEI